MSYAEKPLKRGTPTVKFIMASENWDRPKARQAARDISRAIAKYGLARLLREDWVDVMDLDRVGLSQQRTAARRRNSILLKYHARKLAAAPAGAIPA